MKAIYINLDPYLAAFAAWLKSGKTGPVPHFDPLPLAITVPLGQDVCIYIPVDSASDPGNPISDEGDMDLSSVTVDGETFFVGFTSIDFNTIIQSAISLPFSAVATSGPKYAAARVSGDSVSVGIRIMGDSDENATVVPFTVLVRRETASGPVDLVDFSPPAAAPTLTAAAINTALGGTGVVEGAPLAGVSLGSAIVVAAVGGATNPTLLKEHDEDPVALKIGNVQSITAGYNLGINYEAS